MPVSTCKLAWTIYLRAGDGIEPVAVTWSNIHSLYVFKLSSPIQRHIRGDCRGSGGT